MDYGTFIQSEEVKGSPSIYKKGDRIGQLMIVPYPTIEPEFEQELSTTERGENGFGSTNPGEVK
jgi:dUTPase